MLHALQLSFRPPTTQAELDFEAPLPEDFFAVLARCWAPTGG